MSVSATAPELSIVATLYRSEPFVDEFCRRAIAAAEKQGRSFEIILVNDGSPDRSLDKAIALSRVHPQIKVIDLSRNFGHHKAIMTGLANASGRLVFLLDSDLEESPEWLEAFVAEMEGKHADVVY